MVAVCVLILWFVTADSRAYSKAMEFKQAGRYQEAIDIFERLNGYNDSVLQIEECNNIALYEQGIQLMQAKDYLAAAECFEKMSNDKYEDTKELYNECQYEIGIQFLEKGDFDKAIEYLEDLEYKDSQQKVNDLLNGERSLNAFIERYNKMVDVLENEIGVSLDKISLSDVDYDKKTITTSIGAEIRLNEFTDDESMFKYEINSFLWVKRAWAFVDSDLLTADMCCVAGGFFPGSSYEKIIGNLAHVAEKAEGGYGSIELNGYRYVMALTQAETDFSITPLD